MGSRTRWLIAVGYLILYVNCSVLCERLALGIFRLGSLESELIKSTGLALCLLGFYLSLRGLFRSNSRIASGGIAPKSETANVIIAETAVDASQTLPSQPGSYKHDAAAHLASAAQGHIPPTRLSFLKEHPVCAGWLCTITGLPLVFLAWFPLLAVPGIFIGMNWLFAKKLPAKRLISKN